MLTLEQLVNANPLGAQSRRLIPGDLYGGVDDMGTWIAGAIVLCVIIAAIYAVVRNQKKGKRCGNACQGCDRGEKRPGE